MWCFGTCLLKCREDKNQAHLIINCGFPVLVINLAIVRCIAISTAIIALIGLGYSFHFIIYAIKLRTGFGRYLNMVTQSDGDILPTCLALPAFLTTIMIIGSLYHVYNIFSRSKHKLLNKTMFGLIIANLVLMFIFLMVICGILSDIYSKHEKLHDGIIDAMKNYSEDSRIKKQVDMLQIEFQCCGSKSYNEWYKIDWYDKSLIRKSDKNIEGETPFSCCSATSIYPCIHHGIEQTGQVYSYTKELNLSISTHGCYEAIRKEKKIIGWGIIGKIAILISFISLTTVGLRFLQTAHFEFSKFEKGRNYVIWLFGCYSGKKKRLPPPVPPVPPDLME